MKSKKFLKTEDTHPLTWRIRDDNKTVWLNEYLNKNGYQSAKNVMKNFSSEKVIKLIKDSKLRGRGGAGFFTGIKWGLISKKNGSFDTSYLICNADEMEPGTYKDRFLMENIPHLLLEGIIISSFAIGANYCYIFIRSEYIKAIKNILKAIEEAKSAGFFGKNIFFSDYSLDISVHISSGRYICGEETALINSLEGKRANPRFKPPYPSQIGLFGKPSCINNVETLCNIPAIIEKGVNWYSSLSIYGSKDLGTKLMGFSGMVNNPGIWELPFGISARELLENYAHGMKDKLFIKAWQPGGVGTGILPESKLDLPMDFDSLLKEGSRLGTAIAIAIDNRINIVSLLYNIESFFSRESCGFCTPCRDGLPWALKILKDLKSGRGKKDDIKTLEEICDFLSPGNSFCSFAPGAIEPLRSAIKYFRSEFNFVLEKKN